MNATCVGPRRSTPAVCGRPHQLDAHVQRTQEETAEPGLSFSLFGWMGGGPMTTRAVFADGRGAAQARGRQRHTGAAPASPWPRPAPRAPRRCAPQPPGQSRLGRAHYTRRGRSSLAAPPTRGPRNRLPNLPPSVLKSHPRQSPAPCATPTAGRCARSPPPPPWRATRACPPPAQRCSSRSPPPCPSRPSPGSTPRT